MTKYLKHDHSPDAVCPICSPTRDNGLRGTRIDATWGFSDAIDQYMVDRKRDLKPSTFKTYTMNATRLKEFFQDMRLDAIHIGNLTAYQTERSEVAGPTLVNGELSLLQQLLKQVRLWEPFTLTYKPLKLSKEKVRQNMSEAEEERLTRVCLKPGKRLLAGHCLIIMANSTAGFGELRHMRRMDVRLDVAVPFMEINGDGGGAKNEGRKRTIPLNPAAIRSMRWIIQRWQTLGGTDPEQYILPQVALKGSGGVDFTKPMGHVYRAARGIFNDADLAHLDPYDMRSHAITKILSDPNVSAQVSQEIAGHISQRMQNRYSKQRLETKAAALNWRDIMAPETP